MTLPPTPTPTRALDRQPGSGGLALRRRVQARPISFGVLFAVIACGLVVAAATVVPLGSKVHDADAMSADVEPATYAMQATGELDRLAALPALPDADLGTTDLEGPAVAALRQSLDDVLAALDDALAAAALPEVPAGYLPGSPLAVDLPAAQPYPTLDLEVPDVGVGTLRLRDVPVAGSPVGQAQPSPLDDLLGQVEDLQGQLEDLLAGTPAEDLPLQDLPIGGLPGTVQGTDDAVQPDEDGATQASQHAASALGVTTSVYGDAAADLEAILALYEQLADKVQQAIDDVRAAQDEAEGAIDAALQERLDAIASQVAGLEAEASALVKAHAKAVADARKAANQAITQAAAASASDLELAADGAVHDLQAQAESILAQAEQRKAGIQAVVTTAGATLGTDDEAQQALQAVQAAATAASLKVDRDAKAQVAAVLAQAQSVRDEAGLAQVRLGALVQDARVQANDTVQAALATDADVLDYLLAVAEAKGQLMEAREAKLAVAAVADVRELAEGHVTSLVERTVEQADAAQDTLSRAGETVGRVEELLVGEVGEDLDYVAKVGEDYGRVPTEERKERASHWSGMALQLGGVLDQALADGHAIELLAEDALAAAEQAQAEVAALA